jgi:hypothetical protein
VRAPPSTTIHADVAIVDVDDTGTGTLQLDGQLVDHMVEAQPRLVMRVLLDYAATLSRDLTVLTRYPDGHSAVHQIRPDGAVALVRRPLTSSDSASPAGREHRHSDERTVRAANSRDCARVATVWKWTSRWLVGHGLWLMLGAEILLLVGSLTFIVVALAPYLWPRP